MKLLVKLADLSVHEATADEMAFVTGNGQHEQLEGFVIADVNLTGSSTEVNLFHPDSSPSAGHIDVRVHYMEDKVSFHWYGGTKFVPKEDMMEELISSFPTGAWSLVQVTLAVEGWLHQRFMFFPRLRGLLLSGLD
jgi:hypothetical protein